MWRKGHEYAILAPSCLFYGVVWISRCLCGLNETKFEMDISCGDISQFSRERENMSPVAEE